MSSAPETKKIEPKMQPWPPLLTDATRPFWAIWRDRLMTVVLWVTLITLIIHQSVIFLHKLDEVLYPADPTSVVIWEFRLLPFLIVASILIIRLFIWGVISKKSLDKVIHEAPPTPLALAREAERARLSPQDIQIARQSPVVVIDARRNEKYVIHEMKKI